MKIKIFTLLILVFLMFSLVSCAHKTYKDAIEYDSQDNEWANGYFTIIKSWGGLKNDMFMIVYANDTKVMYFICTEPYGSGITPLYNTDGTLQIYDLVEEEE